MHVTLLFILPNLNISFYILSLSRIWALQNWTETECKYVKEQISQEIILTPKNEQQINSESINPIHTRDIHKTSNSHKKDELDITYTVPGFTGIVTRSPSESNVLTVMVVNVDTAWRKSS